MNHPAISHQKTPGALPLIDHLDMDRCYVDHQGWFVDPSKINAAVLKPASLYKTVPKLLIRFLSSGIVTAKDDVGYASTNLVYHVTCRDKASFSAAFLCSVLCSRLLNFWYRTAFQNEEIKFPHVQKSHLVRLPIRRIVFATSPTERERCVAKGCALYERSLAKNDATVALDFVGKQLNEKRADVIHDLLAFLAERMMELNKNKQTTAKKFLGDLKDFHSIDAHGLTPKTKLDKFWELETADVFAHLRKNAKALATQGARLKEPDEEKIRARFQKAKAKLVPLDTQIAFTDRLIDQIVYRLYGLTNDEIQLLLRQSSRGAARPGRSQNSEWLANTPPAT